MFEKAITSSLLAVYFAATIGAVALAAGLDVRSLQAGNAGQQATRKANSTPVIALERVLITGERTTLASQAPRQDTIIR